MSEPILVVCPQCDGRGFVNIAQQTLYSTTVLSTGCDNCHGAQLVPDAKPREPYRMFGTHIREAIAAFRKPSSPAAEPTP